MWYLIYYYLIGVLVSLFHIWFYRYSKYKQRESKNDAILALIGVWLWPIQIILFLYQRKQINNSQVAKLVDAEVKRVHTIVIYSCKLLNNYSLWAGNVRNSYRFESCPDYLLLNNKTKHMEHAYYWVTTLLQFIMIVTLRGIYENTKKK